MNLVLHYSPGACSLAAHVALEEAGADFEARRVLVHAGETRMPAYLAINPRGRVPALDVDGTTLTEVCAILMFVARSFPSASLLPQRALDEARCLSIMAWLASTVHPTFAHIVRPARFSDDEAAFGSMRDKATASFLGYLREIDELIGDRSWAFDTAFSLCDAYCLPFWGFGRRIRLPMEQLTNFTRWKDRMIKRPGVRRALVREESVLLRKQPVTPIERNSE